MAKILEILGGPETTGFGTILVLWMALVLVLNDARWISGFPTGLLAEGVEQGVVQAET